MAHMIEENMIAYQGERPWHGLGVEVAPGTKGPEMLKLAGLDWTVEKRPVAIATAPYTQDEISAMENPHSAFDPAAGKNFSAITRSDTGKVFQIASPFYHPVQNEEVVNFFNEYCEAGHATMETVGGLNGGAIVWALARLNGGTTKTLQGTDELRGYLLLTTSHDGKLSTMGRATQVRVVCWNTLSAALWGNRSKTSLQHGFKFSHGGEWTPARRDEAKSIMGMAGQQVIATNDLAEQLAKVTIDESGWMDFMNRLMGGDEAKVIDPKKADLTYVARTIQQATINSPGSELSSAKGTLWGAVNGVTYYADHQRGRTQESRMTAAWFGEGERLKQRAIIAAAEIAGLELATV